MFHGSSARSRSSVRHAHGPAGDPVKVANLMPEASQTLMISTSSTIARARVISCCNVKKLLPRTSSSTSLQSSPNRASVAVVSRAIVRTSSIEERSI